MLTSRIFNFVTFAKMFIVLSWSFCKILVIEIFIFDPLFAGSTHHKGSTDRGQHIQIRLYEAVSKRFRTESLTKYTLTTIKHSLRSNTKGYGGKTH
jgi:hypothetical protein